MNIVVVESPAKAKTINKYLGKGYEVLASFGHVRDLPAKSGSVDPDADFHMLCEGEAISWHVLQVLREKKALKSQPIERVVFNAITKQAVTEAMAHPRKIDQ